MYIAHVLSANIVLKSYNKKQTQSVKIKKKKKKCWHTKIKYDQYVWNYVGVRAKV